MEWAEVAVPLMVPLMSMGARAAMRSRFCIPSCPWPRIPLGEEQPSLRRARRLGRLHGAERHFDDAVGSPDRVVPRFVPGSRAPFRPLGL